tara:strand:- start:226 stop:561 length:336 start_codon:yes stop_codon:yes gene_type:complete
LKLITKEIERKAPPLYANENVTPIGDAVAVAKFFDPSGRYTFYMTEYDSDDRMGFGWIVSPLEPSFDELGYVDMSVLEGFRGTFGLGIERDRYFSPKPLREALPNLPDWML